MSAGQRPTAAEQRFGQIPSYEDALALKKAFYDEKAHLWSACLHCGGLHAHFSCPRIQSAEYGEFPTPRAVRYWPWDRVDWSRVVFVEEVEEALSLGTFPLEVAG